MLHPINRPSTGMIALNLDDREQAIKEVDAWVYVWTAPLTDLEPKIWRWVVLPDTLLKSQYTEQQYYLFHFTVIVYS